jgi:malonyl CoA-acyl carrier protein transacylase
MPFDGTGFTQTPKNLYALGSAIMYAGRKLGLPVEQARNVLEWQVARPVPDWNDEPQRTHAEVVAAFDAGIAALDGIAVD